MLNTATYPAERKFQPRRHGVRQRYLNKCILHRDWVTARRAEERLMDKLRTNLVGSDERAALLHATSKCTPGATTSDCRFINDAKVRPSNAHCACFGPQSSTRSSPSDRALHVTDTQPSQFRGQSCGLRPRALQCVASSLSRFFFVLKSRFHVAPARR